MISNKIIKKPFEDFKINFDFLWFFQIASVIINIFCFVSAGVIYRNPEIRRSVINFLEPKTIYLNYKTCFNSYIKNYSLGNNNTFQKNSLLDYLTSFGLETLPSLETAALSSLFIGALCRTTNVFVELNTISTENISEIISNPSLNYDFKLFSGKILNDTILEPTFKKLMQSSEINWEQKIQISELFIYNFQAVLESIMRHNSGVSCAVHSIIDQQNLAVGLPLFVSENLENNKENCALLVSKKNAIIQIFQNNAVNIEVLPQIWRNQEILA